MNSDLAGTLLNITVQIRQQAIQFPSKCLPE
jgi:hypothetical protein